MKRPMVGKLFTQSLALSAALVFAGSSARAQEAAPQQNSAPAAGQRSDGQIEMDVVQALDQSEALKNDLITAATIQSQVTLSGTVSSDASRQLAESIVSKVQGVTKVKNNLKVGNPADAQVDEATPPQNADNGGAPQTMTDNQQPQYAPNDQGAQQQGYDAPQSGAPQANNAPPPYYGQNAPPPSQQNYPQSQPGYPPPPGYGPQGGYPPPGYRQQQPGYPPPGYAQRPQYAPAPHYSVPNGPITVPQGSVLQVRTVDSLDDKRAKDGTPVDFTVIRDVTLNGWLAVPRGATVHGVVTESKSAGDLGGTPVLGLKLTSLELGGKSYPVDSDEFKVKGPNKAGRTAGNVVGGALLGAIIGGFAGGGGGAAIGAVAGGTVGTAASAATPGPRAWIPAEAQVTFHLNSPLTVDPVSQEEASRLAEGLNAGGPNLYRRGYYDRPYGPAYYGPVYYRPYYMMGGYYYWR